MAGLTWNQEPFISINEACISGDVQSLSRIFSAHGVTATNHNKDHIALLHYACRQCFRCNAIAILTYILTECGYSTDNISCEDVGTQALSTEILDVLLAHGWNINSRVGNTKFLTAPLLWKVLGNEDLVKYCLEHGASVHPEGQSPLQPDFISQDQRRCSPVLESAAAEATVATFDLLRAHGAPLGRTCLHHAVQEATLPWLSGRPDALTPVTSDAGDGESKRYPKTKTYAERMAMVYHLVEDLGLDVNGSDQPPSQRPLPMRRGPPLCYVADSEAIFYGAGSEDKAVLDTRELTWYLLDHGADPRPALEAAKMNNHPMFAADVEAWRARKNERASKCCCQ